MSDTQNTVLIVDDSVEDIHVTIKNIQDTYSVQVAKNGVRALELANEKKPDVILLDVEMPEMNGYEVCRKLKANPETKNIEVIFISAHDTLEEKLAGYQAGGGDYLIKPIEHDELTQKIEIAIKRTQEVSQLESEKSSAVDTAMMAMSSSGELGVVLEFLRHAFNVKGVDGLGKHITTTLKNGYNLESCVQIRTKFGQFNFSSTGPSSPLEQELLLLLKDGERIMERESRLIMNFGDLSLLVKNMPIDDLNARGRMRDNIAMLLEGAEARLHSSEIMEAEITQLIEETQEMLDEVNRAHRASIEASEAIMDETMIVLEEAFFHLSLLDHQEKALTDLFQNAITKTHRNTDNAEQITQQIERISEHLKKLL